MIFREETEAIVRRELALFILVCLDPCDVKTIESMLLASKDFDWEVKSVAFKVIRNHQDYQNKSIKIWVLTWELLQNSLKQKSKSKNYFQHWKKPISIGYQKMLFYKGGKDSKIIIIMTFGAVRLSFALIYFCSKWFNLTWISNDFIFSKFWSRCFDEKLEQHEAYDALIKDLKENRILEGLDMFTQEYEKDLQIDIYKWLCSVSQRLSTKYPQVWVWT